MFHPPKRSISSRLLSTEKTALWRAALPASRSVFGSVEFCSIVQRHQGARACLYLFSDGEAQVAYPFFLREVQALPFVPERQPGWDSKSPEFTGPIVLRPGGPGAAAGFREAFTGLCRETGVIAEFAHLHPWEENHALLDQARLSHDRQIIYIDLAMPLERMWEESFNHACRKNIRRAERENVRIFPASAPGDIDEFHRIYIKTMDRNMASGHYYFPRHYFAEIMEALPDNALMLMAEYQGQVVAGTLYLHDGENIYSYLGGQDHDFQHVRPTNRVVYEVIRWGQEQGKRRLILGGGYRPDDGIYHFKSSFSPLRADFYVYRSIHLEDAYQELCRAWTGYYGAPLEGGGYFPLYRSAPPAPAAAQPEEPVEKSGVER